MGCGQTKASAPVKAEATSTLLDSNPQPAKQGIFDSVGGIAGLKAEIDKLSVEELTATLMAMPEDVRTKVLAVLNTPVPASTSTLLNDLGGKAAIEKLSVDEFRTAFQLLNPEASKKLKEVLGITDSVDTAPKEEVTVAPEPEKAEILPEPVAEILLEEPVDGSLPAPAPKKPFFGFFSFCSASAETEADIVVVSELA